jgi:hypothetical protein
MSKYKYDNQIPLFDYNQPLKNIFYINLIMKYMKKENVRGSPHNVFMSSPDLNKT